MTKVTMADLGDRLALALLGTVLLYWSQSAEAAGGHIPWLEGEPPARRASEAFYIALTSGLGLSLLLLALKQSVGPRVRLYAFSAFLFSVLLTDISTLLVTRPYGADNATAGPYAAELLMQGAAPYRDYRVSDAVARFGLDEATITRSTTGEAWEPLAYPAGSFLVLAPLVAAGIADVRPLVATCLLAMMLILYVRAPEPMKLPVLAFLHLHHFVNLGLLAPGLQEPLWGLPVLLAVFLAGRPRWAGGLLGVAASIKQLASLFVPFYAAYLFRARGPRAASEALLVSAAAFLLPNLPFILSTPQEWVQGVFGIGIAPLPAWGVGPAVFTSLALPAIAPAAHAVLTVVAMVGGLAWMLLGKNVSERWTWVLPLLPLWFAWRTLFSYFYLLPLLALAALLAGGRNWRSARGSN